MKRKLALLLSLALVLTGLTACKSTEKEVDNQLEKGEITVGKEISKKFLKELLQVL